MASILEQVWEYKKFSELTPTAAEKAIKQTTLFSLEVPWGKSMDPASIENLFHPDGSLTRLTISDRDTRYPPLMI